MAESNRLERFCRPLPNRSDNAPCPMFIGLFAGAKVLFLFGMTKFFAYFFVFFFSRYLSVPLWRRLCWGHPVASDSQKMSLCIVFPSDGFRTNPTGNQQPTLSTMVICGCGLACLGGRSQSLVNSQWSFAGFGLACLGGRSQSLVNPQWSFVGFGLAGVRGRFQFIVKLQVDCVGNSLVINVLHTSTVGTGFIPALAAADEKSSKCPAAGRVGINPTPAPGKCTIDAWICTL